MAERITPEEVREIAEEAILGVGVADILFTLADQMEADADERTELIATTDLFTNCLERAGQMWQEAHPGKAHIYPDGAKNIVWLLDELYALKERLKGRVLVKPRVSTWRPNGWYWIEIPPRCMMGATIEEATANMQAAVDKEERNA